MTKRLRPDQFPSWYDGQSINEAAFCREFLASHKLLYTENSFFTPEGRMTDEAPLKMGNLSDHRAVCVHQRSKEDIQHHRASENHGTHRRLPATDRPDSCGERHAVSGWLVLHS